jgi:hypothetical protein
MRTVALWVFGLLAGGSFGGLIGFAISSLYGGQQYDGFLGLIGGVSAFVCARLWATEKLT